MEREQAWERFRAACDRDCVRISALSAKDLFCKGYAAGQQQWVDVADRLPFKEGWYLVVYEDDDGLQSCAAEMVLNDDQRPEFNTVYGFKLSEHQIVAWMPIPEYQRPSAVEGDKNDE